MYRRAEIFKIAYPLSVDEIRHRFKNVKNVPRKARDKNKIDKKITLDCSFENKKEKDGNYILGVDIEYQLNPGMGIPCIKTRDLFAFIFYPQQNTLAVLGRDDALRDAIHQVSKILYPDSEGLKVFDQVQFDKDSLVDFIRGMRKDDPKSWCTEHNARHDAVPYQGRKTKSNFALEDGNCVLDDPEALDEIANATSISPKYRFYSCTSLVSIPYKSPKVMSFKGKEGVISISIARGFEDWYRFITDSVLDSLELT